MERLMKAICGVIFAISIILTSSCNGIYDSTAEAPEVEKKSLEDYTAEEPYVIENPIIPEKYMSVRLEDNQDLYSKYSVFHNDGRTWDYIFDNTDSDTAYNRIFIGEVVSTKSYCWYRKGVPAGYTFTTIEVKQMLKGSEFPNAENGIIYILEYYYITPYGELVRPEYRITGQVGGPIPLEQFAFPLLQKGSVYVFSLFEKCMPLTYHVCLTEKIGSSYDSIVDVCHEYEHHSGYPWFPCNRIYEFNAEAYARSCEIVEKYESEGKSREDGTYYLYHSMVKEAWERFEEYR